jgi:G3E family GTPase
MESLKISLFLSLITSIVTSLGTKEDHSSPTYIVDTNQKYSNIDYWLVKADAIRDNTKYDKMNKLNDLTPTSRHHHHHNHHHKSNKKIIITKNETEFNHHNNNRLKVFNSFLNEASDLRMNQVSQFDPTLPWIGTNQHRLISCLGRDCHPQNGDLLVGRKKFLYASSTCGVKKPEYFCVYDYMIRSNIYNTQAFLAFIRKNVDNNQKHLNKKCFICDSYEELR